jgi:hypothetical protein
VRRQQSFRRESSTSLKTLLRSAGRLAGLKAQSSAEIRHTLSINDRSNLEIKKHGTTSVSSRHGRGNAA